MDRTLATVSFRHPSLAGPGPVEVRQDLGGFDGVDGTARWVWPGALRAAEWLCDRGPEWIRGKRVVELGAGTGMLGIVAARLGAASVVLTDAPSELALLRHNAQRANETRAETCETSVAPLAWGDSRAIADLAPPFDVVLCSDVLYQNPPEAQTALAATMAELMTTPTSGAVEGANEATGTRRALFAYQFRENVLEDRVFFEATETLFGDPIRHDVPEDDREDLWLYEYRPLRVKG